MPLLDHFHPPLSIARHWESLHARWASAIADALNRDWLPGGYYAEEHVHFGSQVEVDVATLEGETGAAFGGIATATVSARTWAPPAPNMTVPAVFPDSLQVLVFSGESGPTLVGALELVSPGNKDRPEYRRAFASKCASYLQQGIGLIVVDVVTSRQANLHNELVELLEWDKQFLQPADPLYAMAYRPVRRTNIDQIDVWSAVLTVGQSLPVLPLALDKGLSIPLDLESTYTDACQRRRLP